MSGWLQFEFGIGTRPRINEEVTGPMMKSLSKPVRKTLRHWTAIAYERELSIELRKLSEFFDQFKSGKNSPFEVSEAIHKFHDGIARELYGTYVLCRGEEQMLVSSAVSNGILSREELPAELLEFFHADFEMD
jgi:hypothetical protein